MPVGAVGAHVELELERHLSLGHALGHEAQNVVERSVCEGLRGLDAGDLTRVLARADTLDKRVDWLDRRLRTPPERARTA